MRHSVITLAFALGVLSSTATFAATVDAIQGKVSINRGNGFEELAGPSTAKPGDSVMASPESSARVVYSDQCKVKVEPGTVVVIAPETPCKVVTEGQYEPTGGSLKDEPVVEQPDYTRHYLIGAAIVGGIVACVTLCDDDDKDASP